jgi:glycosyltransferase involved in cell wall biosynthesis
MNKKVSIIIPVYNVELYLEECLDSVVNQTFTDMEIILVDDGSADRSPEIIRSFAEKDKRIKVITQKNSGVSAARNTGLRAASGDYILFIDSDDTILPDSVERLYNTAYETGSDLLMGNALWCYPDGTEKVVFKRDEKLNSQTAIPGETCYIGLMETGAFPPLVYLFFMKRNSVIENNLYFREDIIHEDELWCIQAMLSAARVTMIDFNYYLYRQREGSLMNSDNKDFRLQSLFVVAKEIKKLARKMKKENKQTELVMALYSKIFNLLYFINSLQWEAESDVLGRAGNRFFSALLEEVYPDLPSSQQRACLTNFYFFHWTIRKKTNNS